MRKLKIPPSHGVSAGPKMVAVQTKILSSFIGAALAPCISTKIDRDHMSTIAVAANQFKKR
jgi:hypothetical protein